MLKAEPVAVCSRSFSKNLILREELLKKYSNVKFNDEGVVLSGESLIDFLSPDDADIDPSVSLQLSSLIMIGLARFKLQLYFIMLKKVYLN